MFLQENSDVSWYYKWKADHRETKELEAEMEKESPMTNKLGAVLPRT